MRQLRKSKVGVDSIAVQEFEDADADQSGELSVVEIFCLLPQVEKRFKMDLRSLADGEEESDSGKCLLLGAVENFWKLQFRQHCLNFAIWIQTHGYSKTGQKVLVHTCHTIISPSLLVFNICCMV